MFTSTFTTPFLPVVDVSCCHVFFFDCAIHSSFLFCLFCCPGFCFSADTLNLSSDLALQFVGHICSGMASLRQVTSCMWRCAAPLRGMSQQAASNASRFVDRPNETVEQKRSRLLYQSRKRGILENDLLLGSFAGKYLASMSAEELQQYDFIINDGANNEWDLYYWMIGNAPTPEKYQTTMMERLQEHAKNTNRESRLRQPEI